MIGGYKGLFGFGVLLVWAMPVFAQTDFDIPLFDDISPTPAPASESLGKNVSPSSLVMTPKAVRGNPTITQEVTAGMVSDAKLETTSSPAAQAKTNSAKKSDPNIGRKATPLNKIIITPDPLPEVSIDLQETPLPVIETPPPSVNNRQESINIPMVGKTSSPLGNSSNFTNFHDVRQFEIEGFYLGMSPKDVLIQARQKGYFISKIKKALPLFQTSYYDTLCRRAGIQAPDKIRDCIRQYGYQKKQDYVEEITLTKKTTSESFHITFTSPLTGNEAFQINYLNKGDNSLNFMPSNLSKKLSRKEAFFGTVFNMYGYPDDDKEFIWGTKDDAYMQVSMTGSAYDATIRLVDRHLSNEDYFAAEDWKKDQRSPYHFGFDE